MDSEKATAVSPSSPLRARGPSVLDLLRSAAMTPAATSQARGVSHNQKTIKSRRKEKRRRRTNSLSLRRDAGSARARVRADTIIDNRFYSIFFPFSREVAHLFSSKRKLYPFRQETTQNV